MSSLSILILAAGKGTRMKSDLPKVLHRLEGRPLIDRVLSTTKKLNAKAEAVVVGHGREQVMALVRQQRPRIRFFTQPQLNGSGGAVRSALSWIRVQRGDVLVTCGDTPLLTVQTLSALIKGHRRQKNAATVLSTMMPNPFGYGRIVRHLDDSVKKIVEELDATPEERLVKEINTGTYVFNAALLAYALPRLKANNAKKEFYLTDVLEILRAQGHRIGATITPDAEESLGINRRQDLALAGAIVRRRTLDSLMAQGVSIVDPASTYVDETVKVGVDTVILPQTFLRGNTVIGKDCCIGPWAHIENCILKDRVVFTASFAESSAIDSGAKVGPYSRVRPGSHLGPNVHLGNFSEVKKTVLGEGSKVNHLSYLGDAKIGKNVNIGAGCITCNYDGITKSPTFIEDHSFVGSNVNLIAPVRLGAHSVIGAGSSIAQDVPAWALAVERAKTLVRPQWARKKFSQKKIKISK